MPAQISSNPTIISNGFTQVKDVPPSNNNASSTKTSVFDSGKYVRQKYNELYHNVDLYLDNSGDFTKPKRYYINPAAVLGLNISDTVNDWVVDGSITFMYLPEKPPNTDTSKTGQNKTTPTNGYVQAAIENGETLHSYTFRGDGFDILRVMISPESTPGVKTGGIKIDKNDTRWILSYAF